MQRFALIHDGSEQGWQAVYLAFHVAARLGAPLLALLVDLVENSEALTQRAIEVDTGGRAAGISIESRIVADLSTAVVINEISDVNGLFVPARLVPDEETAARLLEALSCPLWIVSGDFETRMMAILVENPDKDKDLIAYAAMLAQRMSESLTGLFLNSGSDPSTWDGPELAWLPVSDFSPPVINAALDQLHSDLLLIQLSKFSLVSALNCTCVVYHPQTGA
jgi:hypothetical protein